MLLWIRQQVKANEKQSNPNTLRDQPTKCLKEIIDHLGSSDHILTTTEECKMVCTVTGSLISCHQEFLEYSGVTIQKKKKQPLISVAYYLTGFTHLYYLFTFWWHVSL